MTSGTDIAVVGMACRFPMAPDLDAYWRLIADGREGVSRFGPQELRQAGASEERIADPRLVGAGGVIEDGTDFDAAFFGYPAREAALLDPQQRIFLQTAWQALEDCGHAPGRFRGRIGVYGGQTVSTHRPIGLDDFLGDVGASLLSANDKDFLTTRVSYKLGLTGPSVNVQAACATSLVAVHLAALALLVYEADMALAGGASWSRSRQLGYLHQPGSTLSADGHVRPFDQDASGFVPADGVGIVVLRRLAEAVADGDRIYAVIKGSALNNDGADKPSYAAPCAAAQERVIRDALSVAGVEPGTVGYVEAHGTATAIGDAVEFSALSKVYGSGPDEGETLLGSVKANIGHADAAAGVAGFVKAALMLHHGVLPPCPNFRVPHPALPFTEGSLKPPATTARSWPRGERPRRAAVSAFGVGGTNAHVVLQEAPLPEPSDPARPWQLLALSARDARALTAAAADCAAFLERTEPNLADVAWTLAAAHRFDRRFAGVFRDGADAARTLRALRPDGAESPTADAAVFMFPGSDARYAGMGRDLYEWSEVFRDTAEECLALAEDPQARDALLRSEAHEAVADPVHGLPALFAAEVALGRLLLSLGIGPSAVTGQDIGIYTAAHFAGILTLPDAMRLVIAYAQGDGPETLTDLSPARPTTPMIVEGDPADPRSWADPAQPFTRILDRVLGTGRPAVVEAGPRTRLTTAAAEHDLAHRAAVLVPAAPRPGPGRDGRVALLEAAGRLWAAGLAVDLPALFPDERRARLPFARYPFASTPMPEDAAATRPHERPRPGPRLYGVGWCPSMDVAEHNPRAAVAGGGWIVLSDGSTAARQIADGLRGHGAEPVVATPGEDFQRLSSTTWMLDPARPDHYARLLDFAGPADVLRIMDLWTGLEPEEDVSTLDSVIGLAHAAHQYGGPCQVWTITRGAYRITGTERPAPRSACAHAAARTLDLETPRLSVRCVDLDSDPPSMADLLSEFSRPEAENPVAYRAGRRWVREFRPLAAGRLPAPPLRDGGTYLITGGLGGVGLAVARHLARTRRARLVLIGRGAQPTGIQPLLNDIPDEIVEEMRQAGGELLVRSADVADLAAVKEVLRETRQRFGTIHGIVHAAGVAGTGALRTVRPGDVAAAFRAKVAGTGVLIDALSARDEVPDFIVLFSSLAGLAGAPGQACYAGANAYLDAFAAQAPYPVLSIGWDRWRGLGLAAADPAGHTSITPGMDPDDAVAALDLALAALPLRHVAVATAPPGELPGLLEGRLRDRAHGARPGLPTPFRPPRTALEAQVTAVWEEVFGIEGIGADDDFFDLGGHSIIALDIIEHCRQRFGAEVAVQTLFAEPTVAAFARALAAAGASA